MTKKNLLIRAIIFAVLIAMVIPSFMLRIKNEKDNKDVIFALNLNSNYLYLSDEEVDESIEENKAIGVNTALVGEESLNSFINNGLVTAIKYNVLCHKYDDESELIIRELAGNKKIHNDSYVIITKRDDWKAHLDKWVNAKYAKNDFVKLQTEANADVYVIYEGLNDSWHMTLGFDEQKLEKARKNDLEIILSVQLGAYSNTAYVDEIERIIEKYDVKYINLKKNSKDQETDVNAKKNYTAFCKLIEKKDLYLILTEEQTQLSNQKPFGYDKLVKSADGKVIRGYETIDVDQMNKGATIYDKRYHQIVNSVTDRNIRVVVINQLVNGIDEIGERSKKTNLATKAAIEKLNEIGYNTSSYDTVYNDYTVPRTFTSMAAMLMMILMGITILEWFFSRRFPKLEILAAVGAVLSIPFTFVAPEGIVLLYPTLYAVIAPCFAITLVMVYVRDMRDKMKPLVFMLSSAAVTLAVLLICATVQTALLAGLDYYLNSLIFRGIKISLIVPIAYCTVAYGMIFGDSGEKLFTKIKKIMNADVKVYWMMMAAVLGAAAAIYLVRSGNVEKISGIETFMRNAITEIMPERPRTKEFLIGWPCLMLFLYYVKNTNCTVLRWCFATGSSILFASVINSFCHVFTSAEVIYTRVFNGFVIGMIVSVAALIVNHIIVAVVKKQNKEGQ